MHWKIPLVIAALLASMTGAALYYRALYLGAEQARQHMEAQAEAQTRSAGAGQSPDAERHRPGFATHPRTSE